MYTKTIHALFKSEETNSNQSQNSQQSFTLDELYEHRNEPKRCLVGLFGHVYDVRKFLPHHPGMEKPIRSLQGQDISDLFTDSDPNHKGLNEQRVLAILKKSGCEEIGTIRFER